MDGNLTMYFKPEQTRQAYLDEQKNPTLNLPGSKEEGEPRLECKASKN